MNPHQACAALNQLFPVSALMNPHQACAALNQVFSVSALMDVYSGSYRYRQWELAAGLVSQPAVSWKKGIVSHCFWKDMLTDVDDTLSV
jgi:hypothetical protein